MLFGKKKKLKHAPDAGSVPDAKERSAEAAPQASVREQESSAKKNAEKSARVREPAFSFEASRIDMIEKSERRAWACAKGLGLVSICLAGSIWVMSPLKQGIPYVFQVDKYTGQSTLLRVANPESIPRTELMDKYWVTEYVRSRETYDYNTVDAEFRRVREMTMADQFGPYMKQFQGEQSLDRVLGPAKMIRIEILSVGIEGDGIARVRFIRRWINTSNMAPESESYWTATIGFQYLPNYTTAGDRLLVNPFGFKVTSYRLDQEFTRGGLRIEPARPVERALTPKEQYDLPPISESADNGNEAIEGAVTVPAGVQESAPATSADGAGSDGATAKVPDVGAMPRSTEPSATGDSPTAAESLAAQPPVSAY